MRRAGKLTLGHDTLIELLHLPEDTHIRDVAVDTTTNTFTFILEDGDWLPEIAETETPVSVMGEYTARLTTLLVEQTKERR